MSAPCVMNLPNPIVPLEPGASEVSEPGRSLHVERHDGRAHLAQAAIAADPRDRARPRSGAADGADGTARTASHRLTRLPTFRRYKSTNGGRSSRPPTSRQSDRRSNNLPIYEWQVWVLVVSTQP